MLRAFFCIAIGLMRLTAQFAPNFDTRAPNFIDPTKSQTIQKSILKQQKNYPNKTIYQCANTIAMLDKISLHFGIDPHLVRAITQAESGFNPSAKSHAGAIGLMQLIPKTAKRFGVTDPYNPIHNAIGGVRYLRWLIDYYNGDYIKVIAAYNAGENAVDKYNAIPPFPETRKYVPKVLNLWANKSIQPDNFSPKTTNFTYNVQSLTQSTSSSRTTSTKAPTITTMTATKQSKTESQPVTQTNQDKSMRVQLANQSHY